MHASGLSTEGRAWERIVVSGGAGFLGSAFVRHLLGSRQSEVINLDNLTYAGSLERVETVGEDPRYTFLEQDINGEDVAVVLERLRPDAVVHFAAETHVTRGESAFEHFHKTNVEGTRRLLDASVLCGVTRFLHISTDEVYGPAPLGRFMEESAKEPNAARATSAYAKTKALADDDVETSDAPIEISILRPTNCFGPWQHPEKAIARWITQGILGRPLKVWGGGSQVRQWMFSAELVRAVDIVLHHPSPERVYNVGPAGEEHSNLEVARMIQTFLGVDDEALVLTAYDRPDHDLRYGVNTERIGALGWRPSDLESGLRRTIEWFQGHRGWWQPLQESAERMYSELEVE